MAYRFKKVTIRTNDSEDGERQIAQLWEDVASGKIPLLFDSNHAFLKGVSPISCYSNYETEGKSDYETDGKDDYGTEDKGNYKSGALGGYDLSIMAVTSDFFQTMEQQVRDGAYVKFEACDVNGDESACAKSAWMQVREEENAGRIARSYKKDYESTVPKEYTKDGKAHCYLYIGVKHK